MKQFLISRWFLLTLAVVLAIGMGFSGPLEPLATMRPLRNAMVASVLFLMALPLEARAMWHSLRRPWAPLLGVVANFGLLPMLAWLVSFGLSQQIALGLFVAAATPCTLASASVWTRRAGGNDSVAILVTILTNVFCFLATPLWLLVLTGQQVSSGTLDVREMIVNLLWLVVLPMFVAQLLRILAPVRSWATDRRVALSAAAQCGILGMIFLGAIQSGKMLFGGGDPMGVRELVEMMVAVTFVHTAMFYVGFWLARLLGLPRADQIAVGFSGSQKTLMVGLQVGMELGITILPMVAYHVTQLLIDTVIADRLRKTV